MKVCTLNQRAAAIFRKLTDGLTKLGDHRKIDNSAGAFMAVCVEIVDETTAGQIVSIAHYFEQNSDLMADPECTFLVAEVGIIPLSFRQDNLGVDRQAVVVRGDGRLATNPRQQADITRFCNMWMKNISEQQF